MLRFNDINGFNRVVSVANKPHEFSTEYYEEMLAIAKLLNPSTLRHFKLRINYKL